MLQKQLPKLQPPHHYKVQFQFTIEGQIQPVEQIDQQKFKDFAYILPVAIAESKEIILIKKMTLLNKAYETVKLNPSKLCTNENGYLVIKLTEKDYINHSKTASGKYMVRNN